MALLGGHEGYKFFWGLPNRFPFAPQKIGIGRNWAPAQFAFLCSLQFWKHSPHRHRYLHSVQSKQQCYLLIETREYGCLQGRLLRALHCRRWRTVGFFREEGMEAKHHEVNGINRVMACMRKEEERLAMCLRRVEVRQVQKAGSLAVAVPRKKTAPKSSSAEK